MKLAFQIFTGFALGFWPIALLTSVMAFDSPGSESESKTYLLVFLVVFYPLLFGLSFWFLDMKFWFLEANYFFIATLVIPLVGAGVLGYPGKFLNSLKGIKNSGYFVHESEVYFNGSKIEADPKSFEMNFSKFNIVAKDKSNIFLNGKKFEGVDRDSFKILDKEDSTYFVDKQSVFFNRTKLEGADPSSFTKVLTKDSKSTQFYKDKNAVYLFGKKIQDAEASSFIAIGSGYSKDQKHAFYYETKLAEMDPHSFESLGEDTGCGKDQKLVVCGSRIVLGADPSSFVILERGYAKDAKSAFHLTGDSGPVKLVDVVSTSFKVTSYDAQTDSDANDGNHFYMAGILKKK